MRRAHIAQAPIAERPVRPITPARQRPIARDAARHVAPHRDAIKRHVAHRARGLREPRLARLRHAPGHVLTPTIQRVIIATHATHITLAERQRGELIAARHRRGRLTVLLHLTAPQQEPLPLPPAIGAIGQRQRAAHLIARLDLSDHLAGDRDHARGVVLGSVIACELTARVVAPARRALRARDAHMTAPHADLLDPLALELDRHAAGGEHLIAWAELTCAVVSPTEQLPRRSDTTGVSTACSQHLKALLRLNLGGRVAIRVIDQA